MTGPAAPSLSDSGVGNPVSGDVTDVQIPAPADWSQQSTILTPGAAGEWDARLPHGTPGPVLGPIAGEYFLYYIGADGDRSSDGGPANRAVGAITAPALDGSWTKHASNPLIPWSALENNADEEEGSWRIAGLREPDGTICLYVTDLVGSGGTVNGDIRLFTSTDGVNFTDQGIVLAHDDATFPGDDEKGVLGAWRSDGGQYHLFYVAKGTDVSGWELTLAEGGARDTFSSATTLLADANDYGHGTDPIIKSNAELAMFFGANAGDFFSYTDARSDPSSFSSVQETYSGLSSDQFAVVLDRENALWHGFFTTGTQGDATGVDRYTAPMEVV